MTKFLNKFVSEKREFSETNSRLQACLSNKRKIFRFLL